MQGFVKKTEHGVDHYMYQIDNHLVWLTDKIEGGLAFQNGYPYSASIIIDNILCGKVINYADGGESAVYCVPSEKHNTKTLLYSIERLIKEKDRKNRSLGNVCDQLSYEC